MENNGKIPPGRKARQTQDYKMKQRPKISQFPPHTHTHPPNLNLLCVLPGEGQSGGGPLHHSDEGQLQTLQPDTQSNRRDVNPPQQVMSATFSTFRGNSCRFSTT